MNRFKTYHFIALRRSSIFLLFICSLFVFPAQAQETGGKKLQSTEKSSPSKMKEGKLKKNRRSRSRVNPNRDGVKVKIFKPSSWNWDKIMWFKAKKSDYKTKDYNPDKKTKYKQYKGGPNYQSESRKPGDSDVQLKNPLIPYDSRTADEGPVLRKKTKRNKKVDGDRLYFKRDKAKPQALRNNKLETGSQADYSDNKPDDKKLMTSSPKDRKGTKMDEDKLMTASKPDRKGSKMDDDKLMTATQPEYKRTKMDNDKLMTATRRDYKRAEMDNDKLMTATRRAKPKPWDDSKLMTARVRKPKKQSLHDDRLLVEVPKVERSKLHGDKLLTVAEVHYPSATMKRISKDIANHEGDREVYIKVKKDSHPGTNYMSAKGHPMPWFKRTQIAISLFWSGLWDSNIQPSAVTDKKPKHRRDKKEGKIWDNTVHPDEWRKSGEKAESGKN